jgi:hypothetical protein
MCQRWGVIEWKGWEWLDTYHHKQATSQGVGGDQCWAIWVDDLFNIM